MSRLLWWIHEQPFRWGLRWHELQIWWDCKRDRHNWRVNIMGVLCCRYCAKPCDL